MKSSNFNNTFLFKKPIVKPIDSLFYQILAKKKDNPDTDISTLERQIDQLVYQLYGLTAEEIRTVEGGVVR